VISDGNTPLANNNGKFYSVDFCESSFRSELYAMLAGILTFKSLCLHYKALPTATITIKMVSDCKTLVHKINNRLNDRRTTNQHRDSDVDLELQLLYELQQLISNNKSISISHVRSHQELNKTKSVLSHAESMNIRADTLTKAARKYRSKTTYTSLPQNPIDFTINQSTINSKYALRSKKAYHSISLRTYLKDRTNWSDSTIDTIWWQIYHNSLSKLSSPEKVIIYKFINDRLPTKAREQKYYSYRNKHCSQCQCDNENEDHTLQCFSIRRKQARKMWLDELEDYLSQNHTPHKVKLTMMTQLNNWLEPTDTLNILGEEENPELLLATVQQQKIGWKHYIRGRLTIEWGNIIHRHIKKEKITNMTAEKWGANLLSIHWKHILKIWKERCKEVHGTTPEQIEQHKKECYLEEIQDLQSKNQNLAHTEHEWLLEDINQLQSYNSNNLQTWIYEAKIISGINQQKIKHQTQKHRHLTLWNKARLKPVTAPIEKSDLDPGEHITEILSDC
jgi:ribonuclease HI